LEKGGPEVLWYDLQTKIFERKSDILMLIDCCGAASSTVPIGAKGMAEVIYASDFEGATPIWGAHSFTASLISELKRAHDTGITAVNLHLSMSNTLRLYRLQVDGREKRSNPHHVWLALPDPIRTINLQSFRLAAPLQLTQTTSQSSTQYFESHESQFISRLHGVGDLPRITQSNAIYHSYSIDLKFSNGLTRWISLDFITAW
jgi:hypothetical protein